MAWGPRLNKGGERQKPAACWYSHHDTKINSLSYNLLLVRFVFSAERKVTNTQFTITLSYSGHYPPENCSPAG